MSDASAIEWTDATWNPVTGCTKVSPGCDNCYAETFAERWRGTPGHHFENGFDVTLRPERIDQPLKWKKPRRVFVNSMSDLFHEAIPDEFIAEVFAVMAKTPQHTYQLLTKRHGRMRSLLSRPSFRDNLSHLAEWPLPNVWLGVSVEDQKRADLRIPALMETPAAVRFLSCEPLLGPVNLTQVAPGLRYSNSGFTALRGNPRIHWVIVGGESGNGARPMDPEWVRSLRDQCVAAEVPYFMKQWGGRNKKATGRELDGRTWDEFPETVLA
jgi:protein gp37